MKEFNRSKQLPETQAFSFKKSHEDHGFNFQKFYGLILTNWPWVLISIIVVQSISALFLRYSTPVYNVSAAIQIQDSKKNGGNQVEGALLEQLGMATQSNVENEIDIFKSRSLMEHVVEEMQLNIRYFTKGRIKLVEHYHEMPFSASISELDKQILQGDKKIHIKYLGSDGVKVSYDGNEIKGRWNDTVVLPAIGKAVFQHTDYSTQEGAEFVMRVENPENTVANLMANFQAEIPNKQGSSIRLSINSTLPELGEDILDKLVQVYLKSNVQDKNKIAQNTILFIDDRLALVEGELSGIEKEIEGFKKSSGLMDLEIQSQQLLRNTSDYNKEVSQQEIQLSMVESLEEFIKKNPNKTIPSSLATLDVTFTNKIERYNALQLEKEKLLLGSTERNPSVVNIENRLKNIRSDLKNSIAALNNDIRLSLRGLYEQSNNLTGEIRKVPSKERIFLEKSRQQTIKQELYLFLLKKREETAITLSSNVANAKIIDVAKSANLPFKPNRKIFFLAALSLGLVAPLFVLYIKELLANKVYNKFDITDRSNISILAQIGKSSSEEQIVVKSDSKSVISEQFRSLRTNLQFLLNDSEEKLILITSSMSGEGKSFVSLNLAATIALSGKKVVLMEMDLRKPKLSTALGFSNLNGFSNYIVGQGSLNEVTRATEVHDNFDFISSGPLPPNPSELLLLPKVKEMFNQLREQYDYIIVDTAPIGLVTDAQLLALHADATIFIVRQNYTYKQQVVDIDELNSENKFPKTAIIFNDVVLGYGSGYGYGYGSTYGYGYGHEDSEQSNVYANVKNRIGKLIR